MENENQEIKVPSNNLFSVLAGMLVGSLAGALTMLLLAPQSGKDTRMQIKDRSIELRDRATMIMEDTVAQLRVNRDKITMGGREKAKELLHKGQELVAEQLERVSESALAMEKAIQN